MTGSASLGVPLPLTGGRGGFTPALSLSYDSGSGNGPFGLGWRLSIPSIRRKTDKGVPRYLDEGEKADTYVLSDAEDLVPLLVESGGSWVTSTRSGSDGGDSYTVQRFRPRVEGAFALIERWKRVTDGYLWWRTISRDNVKRSYGKTSQARVVDPDDSARCFEWLLEEERDERGNVISYQYVAEDRAGISSHPAEVDERRSVAYRYLKRASYGNTAMNQNPDDGGTGTFRFHLVFDYGDHGTSDPGLSPSQIWPARDDAFSSFRSRFDIRCYRLCQRVLMFHKFTSVRDDGLGNAVPAVVRSLSFAYQERATVTTLSSVQQYGWKWTGSAYTTASLPAVEFTYAQPTIDQTLRFVEGLDELNGLDLSGRWQFVDLDGEGMAGLLAEQGSQWLYKRSEGNGSFAPARRVETRPNVSIGDAGTRLVDLDGDGNLDVVVMRPGRNGYQPRDGGGWGAFRSFQHVPTERTDGPNSRLVDLDGDGHADLLVTEGDSLRWYPSEARDGFGEPVRISLPHDENDGPRWLFSRDGAEFYLADMTGDGLSDVVRIRNGSISYWPNRGYGNFGARVQMKGAPRFDHPDQFDPARIRLSDVDGSGPTDLLYIGRDGVKIWFNESGNGFSAPAELRPYGIEARPQDLQVADILGHGTACLVWSAPFLKDRARPLRYVKLMSEGKPWLLTKVKNNLGRETRLTYTPSTTFYLADRRAGTPWVTRLPFPVHCLSKVESLDHITGWRFVNEYAFHHGYFDGEEREFRGFGMVEQWDTEKVSDYEDPSDADANLVVTLPPVRTRTWFHTGAWKAEKALAEQYEDEYWQGDSSAYEVGPPSVPSGLTPDELREAHRALKGRMLRQEVYAEDTSGNLDILYSVSAQSYDVVRLQPVKDARYASFRVDSTESITHAYDLELDVGTVDPRVSHTLVLEKDAYGTVTLSAAVSYPRRGGPTDTEQQALTVVVTKSDVIHQDSEVASDDVWHIGVPFRSRSWHLTQVTLSGKATVAGLNTQFSGATSWSFDQTPSGSGVHKRLLGDQVTYFWNDGLTAALELGSLGVRVLPYQSYAVAYTSSFVSSIYGSTVTSTELTDGAYADLGIESWPSGPDDNSWIPSGRLTLDASGFYQPTAHTDPFGNVTDLTWDTDTLVLTTVTSPAARVLSPALSRMSVTAETDYRLMQPKKVTDPNGTESEATFDALGRVLTTAIRNGTDGDGSSAHSAEFAYNTSSLPASVHQKLLKAHGGSAWQESWIYSDGGGNVVQTKVQAAPGDAPTVSGGTVTWSFVNPRFVGTGRTIVNNKGLVVKQFEPFFSTTSAYEDEKVLVEWGKSAINDYDPVGRNTKVTLPDGNIRTWMYEPWKVTANDEADNESGGDHEDTPAVTHLDPLARAYKLIETPDGTTDYETRLEMDVQGNVLTVTDARGNDIQVQKYDALGRPAFTGSADEGYTPSNGKGETRVLLDIASQPIRTWRSGSFTMRATFDALRRPVGAYVDEGSGERLVTLTIYADAITGVPSGDFAKGRAYHVYDTAGRVTMAYDFRGRTVEQARMVIDDITTEADWDSLDAETSLTNVESWIATNGGLASETFTVTTEYDALDRVVEQTAPDSSVTTPGFDAGGRLTTVDVLVRGTTNQSFVTEITYNARGQRESITYGNNVSTTYEYDEDRFWLTNLTTSRSSSSSHGAATLQDLGYTYDAVGNITEITDDAQETLFFSNTQVSPTRTFTYDSLYRLTQATGREKSGQSQSTAFYSDYAGAPSANIPDSGDGASGSSPLLRNYTQTYTHDETGNIEEMKHQNGYGGSVLWRRGYAYESGNNQLKSSSRPGDDPDDPLTHSDDYAYNDRGAMVYLPHMKTGVASNITLDFRDQMRKADLDNSGNVAWYSYDAGGQRVRKVWDKVSVVEERIYVGGYEVWRQKDGSGDLQEERQTLHVMDDQRRIAMIETLTWTEGDQVTTPDSRFRFQLDDHLGTALVEVDDDGGIISYEEYHPYGSTAWWTDPGSTVSRKRYRYTGKEKDDESGLHYHGARYCASWLGRWTARDPAGLRGGINTYAYGAGNPVAYSDPSGMAPETFSQGGHSVTIADDSSIQVGDGDWLSKYSIAIYGDATHTGEFYRKEGDGFAAVADPDLIHTGETLFFRPPSKQSGGDFKLTPEAASVAGPRLTRGIEAQLPYLFQPRTPPFSLHFGGADTEHFHIVVPLDPANEDRFENLLSDVKDWSMIASGEIAQAEQDFPNDPSIAVAVAERWATTGPLADATRGFLTEVAKVPDVRIVYHTLEADHEELGLPVTSFARYHQFSLGSGAEIPWPTGQDGNVTSKPFPPGYGDYDMEFSFWPSGTDNVSARANRDDILFMFSLALPLSSTGRMPWAANRLYLWQ